MAANQTSPKFPQKDGVEMNRRRDFSLDRNEPCAEAPQRVRIKSKGKNKPGLKSWFARINDMVHNQSKRDIQAAIQGTCAFVFAALVGFKSSVKGNLDPSWILVVMAPMLLGDTLGMTVVAARGAVVNFTCGAILIYVLQQLGMGYHTYTSSCVVFFIVCFWMGYINPAMGPRKIALLLPAVLIVTIVTTPNAYISDVFAFNFLAATCMGVAIDLAIALLVLPRYASFEVTERFYYGLCRNAEVLELVFNAMLSQHKAESEIYMCEADELIRCMQENQDIIGVRAFLGGYEPVTLLRWLFRSHQGVYNRFGLMDFPRMSNTSFWHIVCLAQAVREIHFNEYHARTWEHVRPAFQSIATKYHKVITLLGSPTDWWHVQDPTKIDEAIVELKQACDHMFSALSKALVTAERDVSPAGNPPGSSLGTLEPPLSTASPHSPIIHMASPARLKMHYDTDAKSGANRLSASFFLFHLSELMQSVDNRFTSPPPPPTPPPATLLSRATALGALLAAPFIATYAYIFSVVVSYGVDVKAKAVTGLRTAMLLGVGLIFCEVPKLVTKFENGQWILLAMMLSQSDNLGGTLYQARNRFLGTLAGAIYSYFVFIAVGDGDTYHIVAMYLPALLVGGIIKQNRQWSYFGSVWVTTGLLITFGRSIAFPRVQDYLLLRIQENAVGILLAFVFSFLTFPVRATVLLKQNVVSVLGKQSAASDKILVAFNSHVSVDHHKLSPVSVVESAQVVEVASSCEAYIGDDIAQLDNITTIPTTYDTAHDTTHTLDTTELTALAAHKRVQSLTYILPEAMAVSQRVSQQPLLLEQSVMELIFISKPFPELTYMKLMACQKKVLHMMITIDRALLRISQFSELKVANSSVLFGKQVSGEVRTLLAEVTANLDKWSKQLQYTLDGSDVASAKVGGSNVSGGSSVTSGSVSGGDSKGVYESKDSADTVDVEAQYQYHPVIVSANTKHIETRRQHARGLEKMHRSAGMLAERCLTFTDMAWAGWSHTMAAHIAHSGGGDSGSVGVGGSGSSVGVSGVGSGGEGVQYSDANIHHLFDVLTTFNALFYASNQLASATVVLGNIMYTILTLENKSNHKAF